MDIQIFDGADEVAEEAAKRVVAEVAEHPTAVLAVPTGRIRRTIRVLRLQAQYRRPPSGMSSG